MRERVGKGMEGRKIIRVCYRGLKEGRMDGGKRGGRKGIKAKKKGDE